MSRPAKVVQTELDEEHVMPEVASIVKLSGTHLSGTSEADYNASVREAYAWALKRDNDKNFPFYTILKDYYRQIIGGKSILFSFNLVPKSENANE